MQLDIFSDPSHTKQAADQAHMAGSAHTEQQLCCWKALHAVQINAAGADLCSCSLSRLARLLPVTRWRHPVQRRPAESCLPAAPELHRPLSRCGSSCLAAQLCLQPPLNRPLL